ncbi:MAG: Gfo/Idh/MocA family oxidoreductase [Candidatus Daviesbacteria bacterium]|nr:Gfo/Idh/MocA family oxidoreductase [Candidatus Daviesbacteria bacterium]
MVKVGIIGSGFGLYGLLPAFNSIKKCQVIAICANDKGRLKKYQSEVGNKKIYKDWQLMLNNEKLDALAIAVTPNAQYRIAKKAIKKGLHIFAEKPLAATLLQARQLYKLAEKKKIIHAIDFIFPEIEEWKEVKKIINNGQLGTLKKIELTWLFLSYDIKNKITSWKSNAREGGGALSFYFSHSLYYLEYFAGKIIKINSDIFYSKKSLNRGDVGADLTLKFEHGITGQAQLSCNSSTTSKHQLIFKFEKGRIILKNRNKRVTDFIIKIYRNNKQERVTLAKEVDEINADERVKEVRKIAERFISSCINGNQMIPSFKEGLRIQELITAIRSNSQIS